MGVRDRGNGGKERKRERVTIATEEEGGKGLGETFKKHTVKGENIQDEKSERRANFMAAVNSNRGRAN